MSANVVGYARVSTHEQDPGAQVEALRAAGAARVFVDHAQSSRRADRPQWLACLDYLRSGDTLVVWRLDRLAGTTTMAVEVINDLHERGVHIKSVTEPDIDTTTPMGRALFGIVAVFAQLRVDTIRENTRAGLARARAEGRNVRTVYLHPSNHAGYYPGASQIHLKLVVDADTDAILGAQAIGEDGADKRIDVIAAAITGGITASALADLELAYAPQFGSAKDPVNMLGYIADNLRTVSKELGRQADGQDKVSDDTGGDSPFAETGSPGKQTGEPSEPWRDPKDQWIDPSHSRKPDGDPFDPDNTRTEMPDGRTKITDDKGGTMRLGAQRCPIVAGTLAARMAASSITRSPALSHTTASNPGEPCAPPV